MKPYPLPCPFCGATPKKEDPEDEYWVIGQSDHKRGCFMRSQITPTTIYRWATDGTDGVFSWNRRNKSLDNAPDPVR